MKLNCLIIDDEPVARKGLEEYVKELDFLHLVAKCESAAKAQPFLEEGLVDLIFLDIQMPKVNGIEFLKKQKRLPLIIFTTAHAEFAVEGYALDVIDYLLKPISFDRFVKAAQKARDYYEVTHGRAERKELPAYFFVKCEGKYERIMYDDVLYVEAMQNYVVIHTASRKLITYHTLSGLEEQLPKDRFLRIHKSYLIALSKIDAIDGNAVVIQREKIPVSRNLKDEVMRQVMKNNMLKR